MKRKERLDLHNKHMWNRRYKKLCSSVYFYKLKGLHPEPKEVAYMGHILAAEFSIT